MVLEVQTFKFNETCCEAKRVPEECMGNCREKIQSPRQRRSIEVLPVDRCVEYQNITKSCLYEYGKSTCQYSKHNNINGVLYVV
jgi:hypothetical protein